MMTRNNSVVCYPFALTLLVLIFTVSLEQKVVAQSFSQFRGTGGKGVSKQGKLSDDFSLENNLSWKTEVEGSGWSQPIVWNQRIYLTTAVAENGLKPKDFAGGVRMPQSMGMGGGKAPDYEIQWKVICLDEATGKQIWATNIDKKKPQFPIHPSNSYATESPAAAEDGVYAYFGAIGMVVGLKHDGTIKWKRDVGAYKTNNDFGTGSSLVYHDGRVFVQMLSESTADILCLDASNGSEVWKKSRGTKGTSWSTPLIWKNKLRTELVVSGGMTVNSFNPATGEPFWTVNKVKAATACSVFADEERIYFGGSDPMSKGPIFAVGPGGSGTIEPKRVNQTFDSCVWRQPAAGPGMSTPVSNGQQIYVTDRSILRCLDAKTGSKIFQERLNGLGMIVACPTVIGDSIILVDEKGSVGVVKANGEFNLKIVGSIGETVWSSPGVSENALLIRGVNQLFRFKF